MVASLKTTLKKIDGMLIQKAINKAKWQFDDWNTFRCGQMIGTELTPSERDDPNMYLFENRYQTSTFDELKALP